jgi:hypothetical protein
MERMEKHHVAGGLAFLAGVVLAIFFGILGITSTPIVYALIIIGCGIGVVHWLFADAKTMLLASVAIIVVSQFGPNSLVNANLFVVILDRLNLIFTPVALINAVHLALSHKF